MKKKKPIFKRVWFWVLLVLLVGCVGSSMGSDSKNGGEKVGSTSTKQTTEKAKKTTYYKVGDIVKVDDVTYTLKSVTTTSERNEFEEKKPKYVIKIVYHVKNGTDDDLSIGVDDDVYGPDNNKLDSYPISDDSLDSIAPGKEKDVTVGYGTNKLGTFEIHFKPLLSLEKEAIYKVKVTK
jgi:hypothetical protein